MNWKRVKRIFFLNMWMTWNSPKILHLIHSIWKAHINYNFHWNSHSSHVSFTTWERFERFMYVFQSFAIVQLQSLTTHNSAHTLIRFSNSFLLVYKAYKAMKGKKMLKMHFILWKTTRRRRRHSWLLLIFINPYHVLNVISSHSIPYLCM